MISPPVRWSRTWRWSKADLSGGDLSALTLLGCRFSEVFANDTDLAAARLVAAAWND